MQSYLLKTILLTTFLLSLLINGFTQTQEEKLKIKEETNVKGLKVLEQRLASEYEARKAAALEKAREEGWIIRKEFGNKTIELQGLTPDGKPLYYITHNADAAESVSTDKVHPGGSAGLSLDGTDMTAGEWDAGNVLITHQEFTNSDTSRVIDMDGGSGTHYHATHVAGTIIGGGIQSDAKGMAFSGALHAYDWNADESEMASAAAEGLLMSNHSYGYISGWYWNSGSYSWEWYGDSNISEEEDYRFGFYGDYCQELDQIAYGAPYYLVCKSAGNDRGDGPGSGNHPPDGGDNGYDCIGWRGNAKNIMTIGAVQDVEGGYSGDPDDVEMTSFSSWGPADDSRIKPDIVGNGYGLYSTDDDSDDDYNSLSGTSMSSPNVTGSLLLLQQHFNENYGDFMKSATLKALAIHTANECGPNDGPDYMYGWGLLNTQSAAEVITYRNDSSFIQEKTLAEGDTYTLQITPTGNEPLVATIVWTDPPGSPVESQLDPTEPMLVNDLDITIADTANETTYHPFKLDAQNPSVAATTGDNDVDNVEKIVIDSPTAESYTVEVNHEGTLENGSQDFSIIISGISIEKYTVSFVVSDGNTSGPIPGAEIAIDGNNLTTNLGGKASINLLDGTYSYTVSEPGYEDVVGEVTVNGEPVTENVEMMQADYAVLFNIIDAGTSEPIEGAEIAVDGNNLTTNSSGEATIYLPNDTYTYSVSANGYYDVTGDVVVNDLALTEEIIMDIATGINAPDKDLALNIYPNPSDGKITMELNHVVKKMKVNITNPEGDVVYTASDESTRQHNASLGHLARGTYIVEIITGKKTYKHLIVLH
ncbi:MAG: S8 family serine peptidase [Bacteroidales bacterium]|nr:S8 family serine peptidase [Bacteroidales bacterium]MCF8333756.1 S8 family serine peptidase [Bacteroidales bacterium]